ncbi:hypothetical protein K502DRAFT_179206 [Neoconidiobolus thromboides FSU 785]|nr:hypothetical protein K502DRAFT_179206 [Neoconidiobolus thromboides FSU 785]
MQQNNNLPIGNEQNVQFSPMNQGNQGFQNNLMQGQPNMSPFNNIPNINFQNMNQAQMNNFNLNQLALRNRLQNMGGMNPNNLNAMGMGVYNQMNAMNMMNNMGGSTMNVNGGNITQNNAIKNWNPADPNVSNMGNNNISMNNDKPVLNQIPINMNPQTQNFPPSFNISQANNYMYQQPINYMNYAINPNIPNNLPQNQNKDSNLINQAIKSQLAVRDMQNQAKLYNQRAKNEGKKVMNFGNIRPLNLQTPTKEEFQVQNTNNVSTETNNAIVNINLIYLYIIK